MYLLRTAAPSPDCPSQTGCIPGGAPDRPHPGKHRRWRNRGWHTAGTPAAPPGNTGEAARHPHGQRYAAAWAVHPPRTGVHREIPKHLGTAAPDPSEAHDTHKPEGEAGAHLPEQRAIRSVRQTGNPPAIDARQGGDDNYPPHNPTRSAVLPGWHPPGRQRHPPPADHSERQSGSYAPDSSTRPPCLPAADIPPPRAPRGCASLVKRSAPPFRRPGTSLSADLTPRRIFYIILP